MPHYKSFAELKALARMQMRGNNTALIGAFLLQELIVFLASSLAIVFIPGTDTFSNTLYYIVTFILQLLVGILQVGAHLLFLHAACNMNCQISDLFYGFKNSPDKAIKIQLPLAIISSICSLPANIYSWSLGTEATYETLSISYILVCLGIIVDAIITLGFFPLFYMMLDFPNFSVKELYQKSWEIMKGHKCRLFLLQLSFIPAAFLGVFTCGLALFWVFPYMNVTLTNFYLDIMSQRNKQQTTETF